MRKYYLSHIDFSEIINVTADEEQILKSKEQMLELDLITEKNKPSVDAIKTLVANQTNPFFIKLKRRLQYRNGGIELVRDTLKKLYDSKDYYGFFMYVAFMYGFLEWQVPYNVVLLSAVRETLMCYCKEFVEKFDRFLQEDNGENELATND